MLRAGSTPQGKRRHRRPVDEPADAALPDRELDTVRLRAEPRKPKNRGDGFPGLLTKSAPAELINEVVGIMSDFHPAGVRAIAHAFAEADLRDVLPRIDVPTLLLYGATLIGVRR